MAASEPRKPSELEAQWFTEAPNWTLSFTGTCTHELVQDYPDGTVECNDCGLTPKPLD